jgi:hypothetical protein
MLDQYINNDAMVRKLSSFRANTAAVEHDKLRLDAICPSDHHRWLSERAMALQQLQPPRKDWIRPQRRQGMTSQQKTVLSVYAATMKGLSLPDAAKAFHTLNLQEFMARVRAKALGDAPYVFGAPRISPIPKALDSSVYRAIAQLAMDDSVVDGTLARYLRDCFDPDFLPNSLAFRCRRPGQAVPTHHDGFRAVMKFLKDHHDDEIWVGEYDLRKFFDCIGHAVALTAMDRAVAAAEKRGVMVDPRAIGIYQAFLECYSFPRNVLQDALPELRERDPNATFEWPGEDGGLDGLYPDPMTAGIGVIQGAALSNLVANLVLHHADKAVVRAMGNRTYVYFRFVDDMILLCTSKEDCQLGMDAYQQAAGEQKLLVHEPKPDVPYGPAFWKECKSRGPYRWSDQPCCVPWVGFGGYQGHFNGRVRIRPSSVRKQIDAMREETNLVISRMQSAGPGQIKLSRGQIRQRFEPRLVHRLVGHRRPDSQPGELSPNCVASGFRLLAEYPHEKGQLRLLDRVRGQCIQKVNRALRKSGAPKVAMKQLRSRRHDRVKFYGKPFSMAGQYPIVSARQDSAKDELQTIRSKRGRATKWHIIGLSILIASIVLLAI